MKQRTIYRETTVEWMKPRITSMIWNIRKKKKTTENKKKKKIQNYEDSINSLWVNFKWPNVHIIQVPEGKEKEQEIGNLFEKNNARKYL